MFITFLGIEGRYNILPQEKDQSLRSSENERDSERLLKEQVLKDKEKVSRSMKASDLVEYI